MPKENKTEGWEEEFDRIFVDENIWKSDNEDTAFAGIGNVKEFIRTLLQKEREEIITEIEKLQGEETPGYPNPYNAGRRDVIKIIKQRK